MEHVYYTHSDALPLSEASLRFRVAFFGEGDSTSCNDSASDDLAVKAKVNQT